jgi:phosphatidylserine decarboxylase
MRSLAWVQVAILACCIWALAELAANFPFPSPLIKPLLPPRIRWPTDQVELWVERDDIPSDFREFFGRDPNRKIPPGPNWVSPADGIAGAVLHYNGKSYFVVNLTFWDVHVIRSPLAGVVTDIENDGTRTVREKETPEQAIEDVYERGKDAPVQKVITIRSEIGDVQVRMITSYWASRLRVWVRAGQKISKGERIGRILAGSTAVFEVPGDFDFIPKPGVQVEGGTSIIFVESPVQ